MICSLTPASVLNQGCPAEFEFSPVFLVIHDVDVTGHGREWTAMSVQDVLPAVLGLMLKTQVTSVSAALFIAKSRQTIVWYALGIQSLVPSRPSKAASSRTGQAVVTWPPDYRLPETSLRYQKALDWRQWTKWGCNAPVMGPDTLECPKRWILAAATSSIAQPAWLTGRCKVGGLAGVATTKCDHRSWTPG